MSLHLLKRRIETSRGIIENMLRLAKNPYLALSFGKDSLVMLDLVREQYPDVPCKFLTSSETFLMHDFQRLIDFYQGINLEIVKPGERSGGLDEQREQRRDDWYSDTFLRHDGVFMGLRIEESKARRISIISSQNNQAGFRILQYKGGLRAGQYRCCPVADWSGFEIMLYAEAKGLMLLEAYEGGHEVRTTARIPRAERRGDMLEQIKQADPQRYNLLISSVPELQFFK